MRNRAAIIGAGVSGLTCGVVFAEREWDVTIFADETGQKTTSGAAAAVWFPYDAEPADRVIPWSLITYERLRGLVRDSRSGVSMLEIWQFTRVGRSQFPIGLKIWEPVPFLSSRAKSRDLARIPAFPSIFSNGYALNVPLIDTTIYLDYLANRFRSAGGTIESAHINKAEEIPRDFDVIVNCAGIGARELAHDSELEPHRGQVVIVPKLDLAQAIVCDDAPLMYAIPRTHDCVFGGTNSISENREPSSADTTAIVSECSRILGIEAPPVIAVKVGLASVSKIRGTP